MQVELSPEEHNHKRQTHVLDLKQWKKRHPVMTQEALVTSLRFCSSFCSQLLNQLQMVGPLGAIFFPTVLCQ